MILPNLFSIASEPNALSWEFFHPGVEIHRLYGDGKQGASAALLKYEPGATVPEHIHTGYEHIIVLSGSQSDNKGSYAAGTLVVNSPDSYHKVVSQSGCIVLIIWEKPVLVQPEPASD